MSIWGRKVDEWANRHLGQGTRSDYNRAGLNALWQIALVLLVAVLLVLAFEYLSG